MRNSLMRSLATGVFVALGVCAMLLPAEAFAGSWGSSGSSGSSASWGGSSGSSSSASWGGSASSGGSWGFPRLRHWHRRHFNASSSSASWGGSSSSASWGGSSSSGSSASWGGSSSSGSSGGWHRAAPATETPAEDAPAADDASFELTVPAEAKVYVNDRLTTSTGERRQYIRTISSRIARIRSMCALNWSKMARRSLAKKRSA